MLEFDPKTHTYKIGGRPVPGVTSIIRSVLPHAWSIDEYYLQRGTATHWGCKLLDDGVLDRSSVDPEIAPRIEAWERFRSDYKGLVIGCELPLGHPEYMYAGTLDRVFECQGEIVIVDLKNGVCPRVYLQLGAYSLLWSASKRGRPAVKAAAVELQSTGMYRCHWMNKNELKMAERQFLAILTVYNFMAKHRVFQPELQNERPEGSV